MEPQIIFMFQIVIRSVSRLNKIRCCTCVIISLDSSRSIAGYVTAASSITESVRGGQLKSDRNRAGNGTTGTVIATMHFTVASVRTESCCRPYRAVYPLDPAEFTGHAPGNICAQRTLSTLLACETSHLVLCSREPGSSLPSLCSCRYRA